MANVDTTTDKGLRLRRPRKIEVNPEVNVLEVLKGIVDICVIGRSPLICNRMSKKAMETLILPSPRKNAAEREGSLKHNPLKEYRDSPYRNLGNGPTRLQLLASMFKKAMMTAALDLPHTKKAQIGRLVYVLQDRIDLYGIPQMMMAVTRSADIGHTPDVRTRAILPRWACRVRIAYLMPIFTEGAVTRLAAAAGITAGIGDWRVEKGAGNYGQFELVDPDDELFNEILTEGREAQDAALEVPGFYDDETQSLYEWFNAELKKRKRDKEVSIAAA